ncbi:MAG: hypothetical protein E7661_02545 [Ruminococcaceae bacterium]|nr:hypothetical protein [Oscillospiraceae bacterium]
MKNKRVLSAFLATLMLAGTLLSVAACGRPDESSSDSGDANAGSQVESEGETKYDPGIEVKNYDTEFNVVVGGTFDTKYYFLEEGEGDTMSDSVYERQLKIQDHLGVTFAHQNGGGWLQYASNINRIVMSGGDDYQMVMTHVYQGVTDLITNNSLYDMSQLPSVNLDAPWWHSDLMDEIKINDQYLLGYNDFCLSHVNVISFNKKIRQDYQLDNPYDLVRNKQWTLENFVAMASSVSSNTGDASWGTEDTFGLTGWGWVPLIDFVTSSNLKIVDKDADNHFYIAYEDHSEKVLSLIDTVTDMYNADWSWMWKSVHQDTDVVDITTGRALFYFVSTPNLVTLKGEEVDFGILPYPMYDQAQENYRTLNWNGLLGVPASIKNPEMVGDVLEMLNYYSEPVKDAFYENLLGSKVAQSPDDVDMLNIIWDTVVSDVGIVTCNSSTAMDNLVYMLPKMCENGNNSFSSYMKANKRAAQNRLDKLFEGKK